MVAEIDNLSSVVVGGKYQPIEVVEAKAGNVKPGRLTTELSDKIKRLKLVAGGRARLYDGDKDVTDQYDLTSLDKIQLSSASTNASADLVLNRAKNL